MTADVEQWKNSVDRAFDDIRELRQEVAAKDAEIERLRAERDLFRAETIALAKDAERLAEALRGIRREALDGCSAMDCARDARDALSDNGFAVDGEQDE